MDEKVDLRRLPDEVVDLILERHHAILNSDLCQADFSKLVKVDLAVHGRHITDLCRKLAYHAAEFARQADSRRLDRVLSSLDANANSKVLDVGCGAGQTLFLIHRATGSECQGIDIDRHSIEFGNRIAAFKHIESVTLSHAPGEALPFASGAFSHVLSRVAINYMHQTSALREMIRILSPGGKICLQVENAGMDLRLMSKASSLRARLSGLVDLGAGCFAAVTTCEIGPGMIGGVPGRLFASNRRLTRELRKYECKVLEVSVLSRTYGFKCASLITAIKQ